MAGVFCLFVLVQVCLAHLLLLHMSVSALSHKYKRTANTTLGHMFKRTTADSAFRCCVACSRDQGCRGVSYNPDSSRCELNWWPNLTIPVTFETPGVHVYSHECPVPWVLFEGHCYLFSMTERNWTDSRDYCRRLDAELVDIQNGAESTFVRDMAIELSGEGLWIGIGDIHRSATWSNGKSISFTDFASGQPNNYQERQNCVAFTENYGYWWNDQDCESLLISCCKTSLG